MLIIPITKLPHGADLPLPVYATEFSAGVDLMAAIKENKVLKPLQRALIPTGIAIALPRGTMADIRPRSGLALKYGISIVNAPGTIDADYRGEIGVILINLGQEDFIIEPKMRIAQMVVLTIPKFEFAEMQDLPAEVLSRDGAGGMVSVRGAGGFGSSGI